MDGEGCGVGLAREKAVAVCLCFWGFSGFKTGLWRCGNAWELGCLVCVFSWFFPPFFSLFSSLVFGLVAVCECVGVAV